MAGLAKGVIVLQVSAADPMQKHVHLGDGPDRPGVFLTEEVRLATFLAMFVDVFLGRDQHAPRPTAGVIDVMFKRGLQQSHHHADNRTGGVELATLLAGRVGKLANQIFVCCAQEVWELEILVA